MLRQTVYLAATAYATAFLSRQLWVTHNTHIALWQTATILFMIYTILFSFWAIILYPKWFSPLRHLPQPLGGSFYNGHGAELLREPSGYPQREWINTIPNTGLIRYLDTLNVEHLLVTSPAAIAEVTTVKSYDFAKPERMAKQLSRVLGVGLLVAEGEEHKKQRKLLMPAFSFRHIKDLYPIFWSKAREMVSTIAAQIPKTNPASEQPTAVIMSGNITSRATLDIIGRAGLGRDFCALQNPDNKLSKIYQSIFGGDRVLTFMDVSSVLLPFWVVERLPFKNESNIAVGIEYIKKTCMESILQNDATKGAGKSDGVSILSVAQGSGGFTNEELVNQMMTFLAAGHETTGNAMTWAIYLLSKHPATQHRLRTELQEHGLPSPFDQSSSVDSTLVENLAYLNAVCNEVIRHFPTVALTHRVAVRDTTILGQYVPKGTIIDLCAEAVNHSHSLWGTDAMDFKPDRWIDEESGRANKTGGSHSNYSLLTFLHGPRSCIGQGFAKAEFACLLGAFVSAFTFELDDPGLVPVIGPGGVKRPREDPRIKVRKAVQEDGRV